MFKIKELPEKITTNVVAQAIVTGGLLVIGWVVGLASNLPAWAYLPLALVIIGAALWIINQLAQIRGRQKK